MKYIKNFTLKSLVALLTITAFSVPAMSASSRDDDDQYPKTRDDRKDDEIGSMLGGEGLMFTPGKIKNESTKQIIGASVNKYLWQAALQILDFAPLSSADSNGGVIITDWYSPKANQNFSYKINVLIKDDVINPEAIEVKVFERKLEKGNWVQSGKPSEMANILEEKIIRRARELYIQSSTNTGK